MCITERLKDATKRASALFVASFVLCMLSISTVFAQTESTTTADQVSEIHADEVITGLYPSEGIPESGGTIGDFVVGPGKIDVALKPGQSKIIEVTVANRTGERRIFNLVPEDAQGSQDPETPVVLLGADRGPYSLKDYISVPYTRFELNNNERARIPVTISIPEDAQPGGLYGSLLVNTLAIKQVGADEEGATPQSAIMARIGTLFFITVPGEVQRSGVLKEFDTVPSQKFYQNGPINFGVLYENTGSIHLAPYAEVRIKNMFDEEVGYLTLDPWFVLPQSVRLREFSWDRDMLFGRYTAVVSLNRGYDDVIDEKSTTFWVLPWKPIAGAFGVLFVIFFLIRIFFKRFEFRRK